MDRAFTYQIGHKMVVVSIPHSKVLHCMKGIGPPAHLGLDMLSDTCLPKA
uniref:Uncharacterized protein n=1 Tax=Arion vulgaris TaxID=1028688 RepID=A0A0B7AW22_9EUPU